MYTVAVLDLAACTAPQIAEAVNSSLTSIVAAATGLATLATGLIMLWRQSSTNTKVDAGTIVSMANATKLDSAKEALHEVTTKVAETAAKTEDIASAVITSPAVSATPPPTD